MSSKTPREINAEILSGLSIADEYKALGLELVGEPRSSGMVSCRAFGRQDRRPSAWINIRTGYYGDSGGENMAAHTCSLWDFAVKAGRFSDWQEARKFYAAKANVTIGREKRADGAADWRVKLELEPWDTPGNDLVAMRWCLRVKRGVTVEAIKAAGGTLAYYPCYVDKQTKQRTRARSAKQVVAIPCYGEWGLAADPVAWVIWNLDGSDFDVTPKDYDKTLPRLTAKMLSVGPTRGAMMGLAGLMALADQESRASVEWVWKTGGPTDLLGLLAAIPCELRCSHIVVTNASGETGDVMPHQAKLLAGLRVAIVGDCDEAGVIGAAKWCRALDGLAAEVRDVRLPWPIEPKHGNDIRDFLAGKPLPGEPDPAPGTEPATRPYAALLAIAEATAPWTKPIESGQQPAGQAAEDGQAATPQPTDQQIDTHTDQQIAKALQIDVLGSTEDGRVKVYSEFLSRTAQLGPIAKLKFEDLLQNFGTPVRKVVSRTNEDSAPGMYPIRDVREAIAHLASFRTLGDESEMGLGVWPCRESADGKDAGDPSAIVLVNSHEAAHFNGGFERITHPRHKGNLLAFETGAKPWYDFAQLGELLKAAESKEFRCAIVDDLVKLWGCWRWRGPYDPLIAAGLVFSTWVQSLWEWRPRIDVLGASNTGKSMFCTALAGIFRDLCILTSDTTAAGLRQKVANRMLVMIVDEVDAKNRAKMARQREILEMIRSASRGTAAIRGSGNQKAVEFTLRHIVWVAGITLSYDDAADRNRAIMLNLLPPVAEKAGKLTLPSSSELADLGQRSLAAALWAVRKARTLAVRLKDTKIPGADTRLVESYAVPTAMISTLLDCTEEQAIAQLSGMLETAKQDIPVEADETNLVAEILRATISYGQIRQTVGEAILQVQDVTANNRDGWRQSLESAGIKLGWFGFADGVPSDWAAKPALIMNYQSIRKNLLRGTRWDEQPIDQILRRIPRCVASMRRVGGVRGRVGMLPLEEFMEQYIGSDSDPVEPAPYSTF